MGAVGGGRVVVARVRISTNKAKTPGGDTSFQLFYFPPLTGLTARAARHDATLNTRKLRTRTEN
jgi:hypothetical protein